MHLLVADGVSGSPVQGDSNAVLIDDGLVAAVGRAEDLENRAGAVERVAGTIIPGLRDSHFHPVLYAAGLEVPVLKNATSFGDLGELLRERDGTLAPGTPLSAIRLDDETLAEGRLPTRFDLDGMVPDRPVLAHRYCGHIAVANSAALAAAGVDAATPDPVGGSIDRAEDGTPTGVLREMAVEIVSLRLATVAEPMVGPDAFVEAMRNLAGTGLTGMGAMVSTGSGPWAEFGNHLDLILARASDLPLKLGLIVIADDSAQLRASFDAIASADGNRAYFLGVKIFADGSLGGHTAFMHEAFADKPTRGQSRLDSERDLALARAALELGGMVAIHAIGDKANGQVLDMFETLVSEGTDGARLRLEHASVLTSHDISRIGDLGVIASVQPPFLASETEWLGKRVGAERLTRTYPFRSLREAGAVLAGGSDCPVEPPFPLGGIAAAIDRCGLVPAEGLSPPDALAMYTSGAARALDQPLPLGAGSPADLAVLDVDPLKATADEIRNAQVVATYVDGASVAFDRNALIWKG